MGADPVERFGLDMVRTQAPVTRALRLPEAPLRLVDGACLALRIDIEPTLADQGLVPRGIADTLEKSYPKQRHGASPSCAPRVSRHMRTLSDRLRLP